MHYKDHVLARRPNAKMKAFKTGSKTEVKPTRGLNCFFVVYDGEEALKGDDIVEFGASGAWRSAYSHLVQQRRAELAVRKED